MVNDDFHTDKWLDQEHVKEIEYIHLKRVSYYKNGLNFTTTDALDGM